jgi:hypothetical protein
MIREFVIWGVTRGRELGPPGCVWDSGLGPSASACFAFGAAEQHGLQAFQPKNPLTISGFVNILGNSFKIHNL